MPELDFVVPPAYEGVRLGGFLRGYCGVSARLLAKLKRLPDGIRVNGLHAVAADLLRAGDLVRLFLPREGAVPEPADLPFSVVWEDGHLLAVDKPCGMPMYPCPGHDRDSLANAFASYCLAKGEPLPFRPVYRLDRDTTGLVLLAKEPFSAARLAGKVEKTYLAVCEGVLRGSGVIDGPIGLRDGHRIEREVRPDGLRAVTRWRSLLTGENHSFLAVRIETGRTHQIRVHLAHLGHPLAGDDFYGGGRSRIGRQALHCAELRFVHPVGGRGVRLVRGVPEDMALLLGRMRKKTD